MHSAFGKAVTESKNASRPGVLGGVAGFAVRLPASLSNDTTSLLNFHAITFDLVFDVREKRVLMTVWCCSRLKLG
jgi:hypothetical protein